MLTSFRSKDVSSGSSGLSTATPLLVGCVPLRSKKSEEAAGADREGKGENGEKGVLADDGEEGSKKGMKAPFTSKEKGSIPGGLLSGERPMPEDLFERALSSLFFLFPPTLIFVIRVDGVVARISRLERVSNSSGGGFVVVVEGLSRFTFNVSALSTSSPFYTSLVELQDTAALPSSHTPLISSLRSTATSLLATLSRSSVLPPLFLRQLRNLLAALNHDNAPALVDAFIGTLPLSSSLTFADKLLILSLVDGVARVEKGIELFLQIDETLKLSKRLGERVEQDAQKRAKQFALMQQLLALRKELAELGAEDKTGAARGAIIPSSRAGSKRTSSRPPPLVSGDAEEEEEDEMDVLEKKIAAKAFSPEAREVALKELGRLKKTPPQGAEHGIIRTFCLFSFPPSHVPFLTAASQATTSIPSSPSRGPVSMRPLSLPTGTSSPKRARSSMLITTALRKSRSVSSSGWQFFAFNSCRRRNCFQLSPLPRLHLPPPRPPSLHPPTLPSLYQPKLPLSCVILLSFPHRRPLSKTRYPLRGSIRLPSSSSMGLPAPEKRPSPLLSPSRWGGSSFGSR